MKVVVTGGAGQPYSSGQAWDMPARGVLCSALLMAFARRRPLLDAMFGRNKTPPENLDPGADLFEAVKANLRGADEDTVRIVTAMAGLMAAIAYADQNWSDDEERLLRKSLQRINGLDNHGADAISAALHRHVVEFSTTQAQHFTRELRELADRDLRFEVLEMLVDLAAADGSISYQEITVLRTTTAALGLTQDDYNSVQARYRDKLKI